MQKFPMTPEGHKKLKADLDDLLKVQRPQNIQAISEARAHGDLSENAEYHAAKERQSFIEGRIQELQNKIALAQVIDPSSISQDRIAFGATVRLLDVDADEEKTFSLVGPDEADIKIGKISIHSPIGKSLIGKEAGDVVIVKAPAKTIEYEILEINFGQTI
ncbi:MAG: transcription elongation factor GreA [Nitrospirota bacterium]|nr:transcription elongation factor GreA [Nitrospirota bacterium]